MFLADQLSTIDPVLVVRGTHILVGVVIILVVLNLGFLGKSTHKQKLIALGFMIVVAFMTLWDLLLG